MRISDWSSDVCSSDLVEVGVAVDDLLVVDADAAGAHFQIFEAGGASDDVGRCMHGVRLGLRVRRRRLRRGVWCVVPVQHVQSLLRSEEHTSELPSLMRISYAVFCLKKKKQTR